MSLPVACWLMTPPECDFVQHIGRELKELPRTGQHPIAPERGRSCGADVGISLSVFNLKLIWYETRRLLW